MKSFYSIALLFIGLTLFLTSCDSIVTPIKGSQETTKKELKIDTNTFTAIKISKGFEVVVTQGSEYKVSAEFSKNLTEFVKIKVVGDTLKLTLADGHNYVDATLTAQIQLPNLEQAIVRSDSKMKLVKFQGDNIDLFVSGNSKLKGNLEITNNLNIHASGGSKLKLKGNSLNSFVEISGGSQLEGENFTINNSLVLIGSGGSTIKLEPEKQLILTLSGDSKLIKTTDPYIVYEELSGKSGIEALQSAGAESN